MADGRPVFRYSKAELDRFREQLKLARVKRSDYIKLKGSLPEAKRQAEQALKNIAEEEVRAQEGILQAEKDIRFYEHAIETSKDVAEATHKLEKLRGRMRELAAEITEEYGHIPELDEDGNVKPRVVKK